jgi:transposase-like protein
MPGNLLTPEERLQLEALVNEALEERLRRRVRVLLLYDDGQPTRHVAREAGLSRGRSRYWRRQYRSRGLAAVSRDTGGRFSDPACRYGARSPCPEKPEDDGGPPLATSERAETPAQESALAEFAATAKTLGAPGVLPDDPLAEAGRKVWRYHYAQMLLHEEGTLLGEDIEELHDMRVATRRMRAAFDVFGGAFEPKALRRHLRGLRRTGRALGRVRDLDVFIEKARRYQANLTEAEQHDLDPLLEAWGQEREDARQEMIAYLQSDRYGSSKRNSRFLTTPGAGARRRSDACALPGAEAAPVLIYNRQGRCGLDAIWNRRH